MTDNRQCGARTRDGERCQNGGRMWRLTHLGVLVWACHVHDTGRITHYENKVEADAMSDETTDIATLVQHDIERRAEVGRRTYGERLHPDNGRDALQDAYEEALDLAMYLKQQIVEDER